MKAKLIRKTLLFFAATVTFFVASSTAFALDVEDILNLHRVGLDADTIVNVIRSTTEPLEITEVDLETLQTEGVDERVISELQMQLGFDSGTDTDGGGQTLQEELEEQQRLEAERLRIEQERREAEREAMREELEAEEERDDQVEAGYSGLRRGRSLFADGDYFAAAAVFNRFLEEVAPDPTTDEYYDGKFGLVRSLHAAGIRSAIRADALEVALTGSFGRHFEEALGILRDVVNESGFASPRIADLSNEVVADYSQDVQDEFNYFLGRYYYQAGELDQALGHLSAISGNGPYGARASFLTGVILINPSIGENIRAVQMLQQTVVLADPDSESDQEVVENAYLALARIAYQVGNFGGALYYYNKIPPTSQRATTALFESAWTYFLFGDHNRALGHFHSLQSPYHSHRFFPDLYVIEAAAYLYSCNIDEATDAIDSFDDRVIPLREDIDLLLTEVSDPLAFYRAAVDPEGAAADGEPTFPLETLSVVLADADFFNLHEVIRQLEWEWDEFGRVADDFGDFGANTMTYLEAELNNRRIEAGLLVRDVVYNLSLELEDWSFKADVVELEISTLEAQYLETILSHGESAITEGTTFFVVADDWQFWPWEGEYWFDEVGNYRGNLTTRCPDDVVF